MPERTALFEQLSQQLAQEEIFLRQFHDVLLEEHSILSERKLEEIERVVKHKQGLLDEFQQAVAERMKTLYELGLDQSLTDNTQLQQFMEQCGEELPEISASWGRLQQLLADCKEQNIVNGAIIEISNHSVQVALSILNGKTGKAELYDPKGKTRRGDGSGSSLAKA